MSDHVAQAVPSPRGRETMERILAAALAVFGRDGYDGATTRGIAGAADVSLPAIKYYFDSKEGLYLACAREIVRRYETDAGEFLQQVVADLESGCSPDAAREHLKQVMRRVSAIAAAGDDAEQRTAFVLREMSDRGPAFDLLYRQLWRPGIQLTAALVARAHGKRRADRESHLLALMLHASLTAFSSTRSLSERYLDDSGKHGNRSTMSDDALAVLDAQIDALR